MLIKNFEIHHRRSEVCVSQSLRQVFFVQKFQKKVKDFYLILAFDISCFMIFSIPKGNSNSKYPCHFFVSKSRHSIFVNESCHTPIIIIFICLELVQNIRSKKCKKTMILSRDDQKMCHICSGLHSSSDSRQAILTLRFIKKFYDQGCCALSKMYNQLHSTQRHWIINVLLNALSLPTSRRQPLASLNQSGSR